MSIANVPWGLFIPWNDVHAKRTIEVGADLDFEALIEDAPGIRV